MGDRKRERQTRTREDQEWDGDTDTIIRGWKCENIGPTSKTLKREFSIKRVKEQDI